MAAFQGQRQVSAITSVPPPNKGLNAVDPLAAMDSAFCVQLINWVPTTTGLQTRQGYKEYCTGLGGAVRTIMPYYQQQGTTSIFGVTDTAIYDTSVSSSHPLPVRGVSNGYLQHTQLANAAGEYLICANGSEAMFMWDGTNWITFTDVVSPSAPGEISGVDPATISYVTTYKNRLWMIEKDSLSAWYLPIDQVGGVATQFLLGGVFTRGGNIVDVRNWSYNTGNRLQSFLGFRSSTGEIAVYEGDDPDNADTWSIVALYFVAPPIGQNSSTDLGGDALILTGLGMLPISRVAEGDNLTAMYEHTITKYINPIISKLYKNSQVSRNWSVYNLASLQGILINIPASPTVPAQQLFMNIITGAWAIWNLPAECFLTIDSTLYFGGADGNIYVYGGTGLADVKLDSTGGKAVDCYMFSAYSYFGNRSTSKHFKMVRPIFQSSSTPAFRLAINVDFDVNARSTRLPLPITTGSTDRWDSSIWDAAYWRAELTVSRPWVSVVGIGTCAALLMRVLSDDVITLAGVDWVIEQSPTI